MDWVGGRAVIGASGMGAGTAMILFGATTSVPVGPAVQAAIGLLAGVAFAAGLKLLATWFPPARRGFAVGIFMTATSLGTVIANAVVPSLIKAAGWESAYRSFGVVTIVIAVVCGLLLRNGDGTPGSRARAAGARPDIRPLLRNRDLLLLGLIGFGALWGSSGVVTWSNTLMVTGQGIDPVDAGVVLVLYAEIAVAVKPLVGWVVDRLGLGLRRPVVVVLGYFGGTLLIFGTLTGYPALLGMAALVGIGAAAYSPLVTALIPPLAGTRIAGSAAGAVNAFWQLGSVVVPTVVGVAYAATDGSFTAAFATLALGPIVGAVLALFIREPRAVEPDPIDPTGAGNR